MYGPMTVTRIAQLERYFADTHFRIKCEVGFCVIAKIDGAANRAITAVQTEDAELSGRVLLFRTGWRYFSRAMEDASIRAHILLGQSHPCATNRRGVLKEYVAGRWVLTHGFERGVASTVTTTLQMVQDSSAVEYTHVVRGIGYAPHAMRGHPHVYVNCDLSRQHAMHLCMCTSPKEIQDVSALLEVANWFFRSEYERISRHARVQLLRAGGIAAINAGIERAGAGIVATPPT